MSNNEKKDAVQRLGNKSRLSCTYSFPLAIALHLFDSPPQLVHVLQYKNCNTPHNDLLLIHVGNFALENHGSLLPLVVGGDSKSPCLPTSTALTTRQTHRFVVGYRVFPRVVECKNPAHSEATTNLIQFIGYTMRSSRVREVYGLITELFIFSSSGSSMGLLRAHEIVE